MAKTRKPRPATQADTTRARHDLDIAISDLGGCARALGDALQGPACLPAATEGLAWLVRSTIRQIDALRTAHRDLESAELVAAKGGANA
jgi:hypothetical protein